VGAHGKTGEQERADQARRVALIRSPAFLGHETGSHPENPRRLPAIDTALAEAGLMNGRREIPFAPAPWESLEQVHNPRYLELLAEITAHGGAWLDGDTVVTPDSLATATLAAGAGIAAVDAALDGVAPRSFALVRPPGHHATREGGMGFCLINNLAVAAGHALSRGVERIAIVDWDVHHGNGTQDIFYTSRQVLFCSMHQFPFYPGSGFVTEIGRDEGEGYTVNIPLPAGQPDAAYLEVFDDRIMPALRAYEPELLLVSAGFDAHIDDPIGGMRLTEAGYAAMATRVAAIADRFADGRIVLILEGGYDPAALGRSVAAVVRALDSSDPNAI
jgi:acetoin utilization deacetylase AcuC-like enzyme